MSSRQTLLRERPAAAALNRVVPAIRLRWTATVVRRGLAALLFAASCGGCASYGFRQPPTPPVDAFGPAPRGQALVCVLRPHSLGTLLSTGVRDNHALVGATEGPSMFCYRAEPGMHRLSVDNSDAEDLDLVVSAGHRVYVHQRIGFAQDELSLVDEATARSLAARCRYLIMEEAPDGERLASDVPVARAR